jgi:hypothetical protein
MSPDDEYEGLSSSFAKACRAADEKQRRKPADPHMEKLRRLMDDDVSIERAWQELCDRQSGGAPQAIIEALMFSLRERGKAALSEADCRRRLADLSSAQVREVIARLIKLQPRYGAITDELLFLLGEQL